MNSNIVFENGIYIVESSEPLERGSIIELVNSNCEFAFDSAIGNFCNNDLHRYEVEVVIVNEDLSGYEVGRSNNGGCYAFARGVVTSVTEL